MQKQDNLRYTVIVYSRKQKTLEKKPILRYDMYS